MRLGISAVMVIALGMGGSAFGHDDRWDRRDRNGALGSRYDDGYRDGVRQGERDLRNGRHHSDNKVRGDRDYRDGYRAGYESVYDNRGSIGSYRREPGYYGNGPIGSYGQVGSYRNQAYQIGYQDGINDGRRDRQTGHSFRPTHDDNFKHADRGYSSSFGDKQTYKNTYRQGYQSGYQFGYQGR